jgi:hypothetical protein
VLCPLSQRERTVPRAGVEPATVGLEGHRSVRRAAGGTWAAGDSNPALRGKSPEHDHPCSRPASGS